MPAPENFDKIREHAVKTSEELNAEEGLLSINSEEMTLESGAVANAELGGSNDIANSLEQHNNSSDFSGDGNLQTASTGVNETSSGELVSGGVNTDEEELSGGFQDEEMIYTQGAGDDDGDISSGSNSGDTNSDDLNAFAENIPLPQEAAEARALLESIIEDTHKDRPQSSTNDDGDILSVKNSGSGDVTAESGGDDGDIFSSNNSTQSEESAESKKEAETEVKMLDSMSSLVQDSQKADENAEAEAAEFNAGFSEGQAVGRSSGFGKIMNMIEGQMKLQEFKEAGFENSAGYTSAKYTEITTGKSAKFISGYNVGYNSGVAEGKRLKIEAARQKQAQQEQDPSYLEGKRIGIEAGTKSVSKEAEDKARSSALLAQAKSYKLDPSLPKDGDPSPEARKNKGFYAGYNQGRVQAKQAEIDAKKAAATALLSNPEYRSGYDFGYNLGMNGMSSAQREERDRLMNATNDKGEKTLAAQGVAAGYNKGVDDNMKTAKALRAQQEKALKNDDYYLMGTVTGTVVATLKIEGFEDFSQDKAIQLITENKVSEQLNNPININPDTAELFRTKKLHLSMSNEQKQKFDKGYYASYNKGTVAIKQKLQKQEDSLKTGGDSYNRGKTLGEVAGSAASIRDDLKKQAAKLQAKRLNENPDNLDPLPEEITLLDKAKNIDDNIAKIRKAVEAVDDSSYKRGFYENYTKAYNKENTDRIKAKETLRNNQQGAAAGGQNSSEYQQGLVNGRKTGEMVFNIRRLPLSEQGDLNSKINAVFIEARAKGPDFESGFTFGYNQKVKTGTKKAKSKPKLENDATLRTDAWKKTGISNPKLEKFFKKVTESSEKDWFEYSKKMEDKRGKSPLESYKLNTKDDKSLNSFLKSNFKEAENAGEAELADFRKAYTAAFELGQEIGTKLGTNFLDGFKTALNGATPTADDNKKPYFSQGYQAGKKEAGYQNFSASVLSALGLGDNEWKEKQAISSQGEAYASGYNKHFLSWHKIFLLKEGMSVPENLKDSSINLSAESEKEGNSSSDNELGEYQLAQKQISDKDKIKASVLKTVLSEMDNIFQSDAEQYYEKEIAGENEEENDKNFLIQSKKNILARQYAEKFEAGYDAAFNAAEAKVNDSINSKNNELKGFTVGFVLSGADSASLTISDDLKALIEAAKRNEEPEELRNSSEYHNGKTRGYLLGMQVLGGFKKTEDISSEFAAPETTDALEKGKKEGKIAAQDYKTQITGSNEIAFELKAASETDAYKNLSPENQEIFANAYNAEIKLAQAYVNGYKDAATVISNDRVSDDYQFISNSEYQEDSLLNAEYQKGFLEGRSVALIGRIAGTDNTAALMRNVALQNKLNLMRETMGDAYTDIYKKGWTKGQEKGKTISNSDTIGLTASAERDGAEGMAESIIELLDKLFRAFVEETVSKARLNGESGDEQKTKYRPLLSVKSTSESILKGSDNQLSKVEQLKFISDQTIAAVGKALDADKNTFKTLKEENRKAFKELPEAYNSGYITALESGIRVSTAEKANSAPSRADEFYNQMLADISVKTDSFYVKGYNDAEKEIKDMNRGGKTPAEDEMKQSMGNLPLHLKGRLQEAIENEYNEFVKTAPSSSESEALEKFRDKRNNYKNILSVINEDLTESYEPYLNISEFIDNQISVIFKSIRDLTDGMSEQTALFFNERIESNWKKIAENYKKGFSKGLPTAVQNALNKREAINSTSQGIDSFLDYMHELIEEGTLKDANVSDIDILESQTDFIHQIYVSRALLDSEERKIESLEDGISDIEQELGFISVRLEDVEYELNNISDNDDLDLFQNEKSVLETYSDELDFNLLEKRADLEIANDSVDEKTEQFLEFTKETIGFETEDSNFSQVRAYLLSEESILNISGIFGKSTGNTSVNGQGNLSFIDREERIKYESGISMTLGSSTLKSDSIEVFEQEFYIQLTGGSLSIPVNGSIKETDFDLLDLEMGLSLLQQLNYQLQLGDILQKGNIIGGGSLRDSDTFFA